MSEGFRAMVECQDYWHHYDEEKGKLIRYKVVSHVCHIELVGDEEDRIYLRPPGFKCPDDLSTNEQAALEAAYFRIYRRLQRLKDEMKRVAPENRIKLPALSRED